MSKIFNIICVFLFLFFAVAIGTGYMVPDTWFVVFLCVTVALEDLLRFLKKK